MGRYEDLVEQLRGLDDELAEEFEKFSGSSLRKQAERIPELEASLKEAQGKVATLEAAPKREQAFRDAGVNWDQLSKGELAHVKGLQVPDGKDPKDWAAEVAAELDLPVTDGGTAGGGEEGEEPEPNAAAVARQATRGAGATSPGIPVVKAEDANKWGIDKQLRFREQHPDAWEQLKRGEDVSGIAFN